MAIGYKLFRQSKDGNLHPLFVNANQILPLEVEEICSKAGLTALKRYHG